MPGRAVEAYDDIGQRADQGPLFLLTVALVALVVLTAGAAWSPIDARSGSGLDGATATGPERIGRTTSARRDRIIADARDALHAPALVVMLRLDDGTTYGRAVGSASLPVDGSRTRATLDTPFVIGSLTKSFIAASLLYLLRGARWVHLDGDVTLELLSLRPELALPLLFIAGVSLLFSMLHLARGIAHVHGAIAKSLLVRSGS